jgi:hypothetical protein
LTRIVNVSEFMVSFKPLIFLKFLIYHLLFFYFGFLSLLIIVPIDNFVLANNMSFWITTKNKLHLYAQTFQWLSNLALAILFGLKYYQSYNSKIKLKNIYLEEFLFYNLFVIIRAFIIAVRYGFISRLRLKILKTESQDY